MLSVITADTFVQLKQIVAQLGAGQYAKKLQVLNHSTIGQHVRHVLEFYCCLSQGIETGVVDYDRRKRNLSMESDPAFAIQIMEDLEQRFCSVALEQVFVQHEIEYNGCVISVPSSLNRELVYLIEHSIHHYAIMQIALKIDFPEVEIPFGFGVAYSTIKHKQSLGIAQH